MKPLTLYPYWLSTKTIISGFAIGLLACTPVVLLFGTEAKDLNQPLPSLLLYFIIHVFMLIYGYKSLRPDIQIITIEPYSLIKLFILFIPFFLIMDILPIWIKLPSFSSSFYRNEFEQSQILFFIAVAIIGPILEELVFRGIILGYMLKHKSERTAILFAALLFGLMHISPDQVFFTFWGGIFLGYTYLKSKNILVPIFFHALNNIINFIYLKYGVSSFLDFSPIN